MLLFILLQAQQINALANEGTKALGEIDNPILRTFLIFLIALVIILSWAVAFFYKDRLKDIKKKDDLIQRKEEQLINMMTLSFKNMEDFSKEVSKLNLILSETTERSKNNHTEIMRKLENIEKNSYK